ncbi:MAG: 3-phosphoshikimate 1-carboxyvinyltransferase [Bacillota bacterium]
MLKEIKINKNNSLKGNIYLPADKSISHRSIIFASIGNGISRINNLLEAKDTKNTLDAFKNMGVDIKKDNNSYIVEGKGINGLKSSQDTIYCGNSGTTMRLLSGLISGAGIDITLDGDKSLRKRPMDRIIRPLKIMGAEITGQDNLYCPLNIKPAKLNAIDYKLPVASAQVKSALLLANIYTGDKIKIEEPKISRNHTEVLMKQLGLDIEFGGKNIIFDSRDIKIPNFKYNIPGDFSQAAFFITAALLVPNSEIVIKNVSLNSTRTGFLDVVKNMGANIEILDLQNINKEPVGNLLVKYSKLKGTKVSESLIPKMIDEIPLIAILALKAQGETEVRSADELRVKESDRLLVLNKAFKKLKLDYEIFKDGFKIKGPQIIENNSLINSFEDHRMAMAFSILALISKNGLKVDNIQSIDNSFPNFYKKLDELIK